MPPQTMNSTINFDEYPIVMPLVVSLAVCLQILVPCYFGCCTGFVNFIRLDPFERPLDYHERRIKEERKQFAKEQEKRLQKAASAKNQEDLDRAVQEYQQAVLAYEKKIVRQEIEEVRNTCPCARLVSMCMSLSFYLWLIFVVGCEMTHCTTYGSVFNIMKIFASVMLGVCAVIVLLESFYSEELQYLKNIVEDETALEYIQRLREVPPRLDNVVECFHFEERNRTAHCKDPKGSRKAHAETYTVKVVTQLASEEFIFKSWVDVSKRNMPSLKGVDLVRIKCYPRVLFGDQETHEASTRQLKEMSERMRVSDDYISPWKYEDWAILDLTRGKRISAYTDMNVKPFWMNPLFYWIATLLQMNWPYRLLFRARTAEINLFLNKKVYKSITRPREIELMEPMDDLLKNKSFDVSLNGSDVTAAPPTLEVDNPATESPANNPGNDIPEQSSAKSHSDPILHEEPHPNVLLSSREDAPCDHRSLLVKNVRLPVIADKWFTFQDNSSLLKEILTNEMRLTGEDESPISPCVQHERWKVGTSTD